MTVLVNGTPATEVSVFDRALQFGEGVFETIACLNGRPRFLPLHLERLEYGCERLGIQPPVQEEIAAEIRGLVSGVERSIVKLLMTGGDAVARGYARSGSERATRITIRYPWPHEDPAQLHDGVMTRTLSMRLGENPRLAGLKHCNRLEQVLARAEIANDPHLAEGILFSSSGNLVSGTMTNVFLVRESVLLTPRIDQCGVAGVMRRFLLSALPDAGFPVHERPVTAEDLQDADEVFLSNAIRGIRWVQTFRKYRYTHDLSRTIHDQLIKTLL